MVVGFKFERWTKRSEPAIGDVLLFEATPPKSEESSIYIKRVMGLPGDTIEIRGGLVVRNGVAPAFDRSEKEPGCGIERHPDGLEIPVCLLPPVMETDQPVRVEPGSVFLVGDTRQRTVSNIPFGPVPVSSIISAAYRFCFQKPEGRASKFNSGCPLLKVY
jgi:signal peptidase I